MRIGVFSDFTVANTVYRAVPVARLTRLGHSVIVDRTGEGGDHAPLHGCDVVHIYRYHDRSTLRLVQSLRAGGIAIVWDVDDHHGAEPEQTPERLAKGGLREQRTLRNMGAMARLAHVVTTTSPALAERFASLGAEAVRIVPNYVPDEFCVPPQPSGDGVVVGWIAAAEHYHDLRALNLSELLGRLLDARPELRVQSIGVRFDLPRDRYEHRVMVQHRRLADYVSRFDVAIAPLDDIPFNRARSDVKVKEYAAAGVPWLASPVGPYAKLGEKQGGRLVPADGWYDALDRLVGRKRERRKLAKRAASWGRSQTVSRNLSEWEAVMREAAERAGRR